MDKDYDKALSRLAIILQKLSNNELPTKDDLALEFNVNERTIRRDITQRLVSFPIEKDKLGRYKFVDGFSLARTTLESEELLMTFLGLSQLKNINDEFDKSINSVINKLFHPGYSSILHIKQDSFEELNIDSELFELLEIGISKNLVTILNTNNKEIYTEPYKVINIEGIWYLLAKNLNDNKTKSFLLSKIKRVSVLNKKFNIKENLDEIISNVHSGFFEDGNSFEVKVVIYPQIAHYFKLKSFLPTQEILNEYEDKSLLVKFEVTHYEDIDNIIKSWLPHIEVLEPYDYKEKIYKELQTYLNNLTFQKEIQF